MGTYIIIILAGVSCIFITLYLLTQREIRNITSQLENITLKDTNAKILLSSSNKEIKNLAIEINKSIDEKNSTQVEHRRMEKELRQAIANVSHDLRTPLTSIMGYLQLMGDKSISQEEKEQYRIIVEKRAKALQLLITSFYDLSRLEANEYNFDLKPIKLNNLLYDIIASFYNDLLNKKIEPIIDIDSKPVIIIGDENAVRRIFSNLIQNIIKYGKNVVFICLKEYEDKIITTFKNDGCTLNSEDADKLFERFFIGDKSRSGQSTGLGLAITKKLVEQMENRIYAEVNEGELTITIEWRKLKK